LHPTCGYDYAIYKPESTEALILLVPNTLKEDDYIEICHKVRYITHPMLYDLINVKKVDEEKLRKIVYPSFHHKPHNIILSPSKKLEDEISAL
jgi:hypothetical protein